MMTFGASTKMKVLLADCPSKEFAYDASYPNLGLLYLAGSLKNGLGDNYVQVSYLEPKHNLRTHLEYVKKCAPLVYGLSFTSRTAELAYRTMHTVRQACPEIFLVCGGPHSTALPEEVMDRSPVDVCVVGEGEVTFLEVVRRVKDHNTDDLGNVDGILYRRNGEVCRTNKRELINDLDDIPFPAWELIDFRNYTGMHLKKQSIESSLLISRGCPFDCAFCSNPVWKNSKPWLRHRSVENIREEIKLLYDRGVREIYLSSDEVNFNEKWAIELCEGIAAIGFQDLYFQCNMRVDKVSKQLARALAKINCWLVHVGIESANDRVLRGIGKHVTVEQVENATRILSETGIKVFAFMMLYQVWEENGKLCHETNDEVENSIRLMKSLFKRRHIHYMSWQFCTPMPGSRLYEIAERHDLLSDEPNKIWERFDQHEVTMNIPGISKKTMKNKIKKGIFYKDLFMVKSGNISFRHLWRASENLKAILK